MESENAAPEVDGIVGERRRKYAPFAWICFTERQVRTGTQLGVVMLRRTDGDRSKGPTGCLIFPIFLIL